MKKDDRRKTGEKARKWRRGIGALAETTGEDSRARKFPLQFPNGENPFDFAEAARLFNVVEGVDRGSLSALVCAAHLSGFRLFSAAGQAKKFRPKLDAKNAVLAQDDNRPMEKLNPRDAEIFPHKIAALAAREARAEDKSVKEKDIHKKFAAHVFSGSDPNALAWLFGAGLTDILAKPEVDDDKAARMLDADVSRVRQLRAFARAVPLPPPFIRAKNYSGFRVSVAGKICCCG